jgi:hypothetical protein
VNLASRFPASNSISYLYIGKSHVLFMHQQELSMLTQQRMCSSCCVPAQCAVVHPRISLTKLLATATRSTVNRVLHIPATAASDNSEVAAGQQRSGLQQQIKLDATSIRQYVESNKKLAELLGQTERLRIQEIFDGVINDVYLGRWHPDTTCLAPTGFHHNRQCKTH